MVFEGYYGGQAVVGLGFLPKALSRIALNAASRTYKASSNVSNAICSAILVSSRIVATLAQDGDGIVEPNRFRAFSTRRDEAVPNAHNFDPQSLDWAASKARAHQIRLSGDYTYCVGNLSMALSNLGAAYQTGVTSATTLLAFLPTIGVLVGTPITELWLLYKLMPVAGLVSMLLSLGGNIVPADVGDYNRVAQDISVQANDVYLEDTGRVTEAEKFARIVNARAHDAYGSRKSLVVVFGVLLQVFLLSLVLVACWFMQSGSIVVWWCTFYPWMYFWYIFVAMSSLFENLAGVPFTRQWSIRVWRAPRVKFFAGAPLVIKRPDAIRAQQMRVQKEASEFREPEMRIRAVNASLTNSKDLPTWSDEAEVAYHDDKLAQTHTPGEGHTNGGANLADFDESRVFSDQIGILDRLEKGCNTFSKFFLDPNRPYWSASHSSFYVIVSVRGVSNPHGALRLLSKIFSIVVYIVGTAMFASSTLATVPVAIVVASLVVIAAVFSRIIAMWMASELLKSQPILHRMAKDRRDAEEYIEAVLNKPNLVFEVMDHLILNGRCIHRFSRSWRWSKVLGVLAEPYDVTGLATL